jgi:predicted O-methyltransferase YrrM
VKKIRFQAFAFHKWVNLCRYDAVKLFGVSATNLADKLEVSAVSGATVEIEAELYAMALDVIGKAAFNSAAVCLHSSPATTLKRNHHHVR